MTNEDRIIKGIWIPIEVWQDKSLSWSEKILLMEIDSFTSRDIDCYFSDEYIAELLGVTERWASKVVASLVKKGFVERTKFDGRKRYLKAVPLSLRYNLEPNKSSGQNRTKVQGRTEQKFGTEPNKSSGQTSTSVRGNNIDNNINLINNSNENIRASKKFVKPSVEEIRAYCEERNNSIDPIYFYDHYEANGWMVGKNKMKDWKATVRNWERNGYGNNDNAQSEESTFQQMKRIAQENNDAVRNYYTTVNAFNRCITEGKA